jgi:hypothetical protein
MTNVRKHVITNLSSIQYTRYLRSMICALNPICQVSLSLVLYSKVFPATQETDFPSDRVCDHR